MKYFFYPTFAILIISCGSALVAKERNPTAEAVYIGDDNLINNENFTELFPEFNSEFKIDIDLWNKVKLMSNIELIGQMTQIDLGVIADGDVCELNDPQILVESKLQKAFEQYKVGSVLNVGCGSGTISLERWRDIQTKIQQSSRKYNPIGYDVIFGIDAIHGVNYTKGAVLFPQQIGQAATWNPDLIKQAASITALEIRLSGINWNFSPVLDLGRQPLWSRFFETYGEDVFLAKQMTKAAIQGYQNQGKDSMVAACMKHFLGYSYPLSGKDRTPAWIDDRTLREYYLPTFETAIENGAKTIMINSGEINGTPVHINEDILTNLLRRELHFTGVAVTDWEDIYKLHTTHKVAPTIKDAVKMAILAGVDMSMTPNDYEFNEALLQLVDEEVISRERLYISVYRILKLKQDLGLVNNGWYYTEGNVGGIERAEVSYNTACESITLLKNQEDILPLMSKTETIYLMGDAADSMDLLNGAWTHTWQGQNGNGYRTPNKFTIFQALKRWNKNTRLVNQVYRPSVDANTLIYCLGEKPATEVPGNINDLNAIISHYDMNFIREWKKKSGKIILVLCLARPRIITELVEMSDAVIHAYLPGDEGGRAISDIIYGEVNPSGKLPFTYPKYSGDIIHYDRKYTENNDVSFGTGAYSPLFDFGHGLSYSNFKYDSLRTFRLNNELHAEDLKFQIKVTNNSAVKGKEVVQLYYSDLYADITPSVKRLCGFKKVELLPGESKNVEINVSWDDLTFINKQLKKQPISGDVIFRIADQEVKVEL